MNYENKLSNIDQEYYYAELFASGHYENFPVASFLIPKHLRKHVAIIYKFARTADDIADEGNFSETGRLEKLDRFERQLKDTLKNRPENSFWSALKNTIDEFNLTEKYFFDLISAFRQDVIKNRYSNFEELLDYCRRSANPVGRLILELWKIADEEAKLLSDKVCTALQLTNFYQDISVDISKNRIYIPQDELEKFNVNEEIFHKKEINENFMDLMAFQIKRTEDMFNKGEKILYYLPGLLKYEIKWTILGGKKILYKIKKNDYNVLLKRPALHKFDFLGLLLKAILK